MNNTNKIQPLEILQGDFDPQVKYANGQLTDLYSSDFCNDNQGTCYNSYIPFWLPRFLQTNESSLRIVRDGVSILADPDQIKTTHKTVVIIPPKSIVKLKKNYIGYHSYESITHAERVYVKNNDSYELNVSKIPHLDKLLSIFS